MPAGYRVGVVTNAGGMGTLVADLAEAEGLSVPKLSGEGWAAVQQAVPRAVADRQPRRPRRRPVPRRARGRRAGIALAARARCARGRPGPHQPGRPHRAPRRVVPDSARSQTGRCFSWPPMGPSMRRPDGVTVYRNAEAAVGALARTMRYAAWRRVPAEDPPAPLGVRAAFAHAWAIQRLAARGGTAEWLPASASAELLAPYGVDHVGVEATGQRRGLPGRSGDRLSGRGEGGRPDGCAQDRPRAGAGRTADTGGRGCRRRRLPRRAGQRVGRRPRAAGARRRRGGLRCDPRPGVRAPDPHRRGWRRDRGLEGRGLPGTAGVQRRRGTGHAGAASVALARRLSGQRGGRCGGVAVDPGWRGPARGRRTRGVGS